MTSSLTRAVEVVELLAASPNGLSVTELADMMSISKSTSSRLLAALLDAGLVERDDAQRHFLDVRFWNWGMQAARRLAFLDVARPHVASVVKNRSVSVFMAVARGDQTIYVSSTVPHEGHALASLVSYVVPVYACAPGKAILAHSRPELIEAILSGPLTRFTPKTLATREELAAELLRIRSQGYALNRGEYYENGRLAIAAPLLDQSGWPVAAICFFAIQDEEAVDELVQPLLELASTISASLGYSRPMRELVG